MNNEPQSYTLGLDIGIASVGWCILLSKNRIIDLGVRAFDKAEIASNNRALNGKPLNLIRRNARLVRHRLCRRTVRLKRLARLLRDYGLVSNARFIQKTPTTISPWHMRVDGLRRQLTPEEWARVIYHVVKHRGFHWASLAEEKAAEEDDKGDGGKVTQALKTAKAMKAEKQYDTAAQMVVAEFTSERKDKEGHPTPDKNGRPIYEGATRNKAGDYGKSLSRMLLADELKMLFDRQRDYHNPYAHPQLEEEILGNGDRKSGLFWEQEPALTGQQLLDRLGRCTFEKTGGPDGKGEYRAPKASFTAERQVWLTRLNNLNIVVGGTLRRLAEIDQQLRISLPLAYEKEKLTYKQLGAALADAGLLEKNRFKFAGLSYPSDKQKLEDKAKDPEEATLIKLTGWHDIKKKLTQKRLSTEWQSIAGHAQGGDPNFLDDIAWVLSVYKEDDEIQRELGKLALPGGRPMIDALRELNFQGFHKLSLEALRKIVPYMEKGLTYDKAVAAIPDPRYGHHSQLRKPADDEPTNGKCLLPPLYEERRGAEPHNMNKMLINEKVNIEMVPGGIPNNPVVLRAINQARKVVNAVIRRQKGPPTAVHIEMARDLTKPFEERSRINQEIKGYQDRNEKDWDEFVRQAPYMGWRDTGKPKGADFEKWQLYREQQGKSVYPIMPDDQGICAYSFEPIDLHRLLDPGYVEVDHALPYARSFDDSKLNKVLVLRKQNQDKGDRTPYEYLTELDGGTEGPRWQHFVAFVENNKAYRQAKKNRLMKKHFDDEDTAKFRERNLNDTRYICRFFKNYVERYLLRGDDQSKRCVVVSGALTSLLRARWSLKKDRSKNDRHHAIDAAIVAACGHQVVQRLSNLVRQEGWIHKPEQGGYVNAETGWFLPTKDFVRQDSVLKLFPLPWKHFREELEARVSISDPDNLRDEISRLGTYPEEAVNALKPLFVSRAVQRRNGGAAHADTIYATPKPGQALRIKDKPGKKASVQQKEDSEYRRATPEEMSGMVVKRVGLLDIDEKGNYKLTADMLNNMVDYDRDERMREVIDKWITERDKRKVRAKEIVASLGKGKDRRKPTETEQKELDESRTLPCKPKNIDPKDGPFTGPIIRKIKLNAGKKSGIPVRGGIAMNETMLRVDVFRHKEDKKYHLVPIYVHHAAGKKALPNKAIVAYKDQDEWTLIDDSFDWCFSLHSNDLVKITQRSGDVISGYFRSCHSGTGAINVALHDRNALGEKTTSLAFSTKNPGKAIPNDKLGLIESIGVKMAANFEKLHVDVLGNIYPAPQEQRRGLA
ncbi:type II CRISPR RNA-guided endonuclease Cas9 [Sulfuritalea sp.]|uniref:type II CRISPR RNA-guided endonuclease Cas9 n=1 Tax=Sulfuritalea sp. TaxID=2480090 RepID=UPI00286DF0B1|nr:type II CRISPR RNA-guided endonuclease Cas9 [Sulfuritalea sp.]